MMSEESIKNWICTLIQEAQTIEMRQRDKWICTDEFVSNVKRLIRIHAVVETLHKVLQ